MFSDSVLAEHLLKGARMDETQYDERPVHQPYAPEAPIPGINYYSGCNPDRPRVNAQGVCEDCGEQACPACGRGGPSISCPSCKLGRVHFMHEACCQCDLSLDALVEHYMVKPAGEAARMSEGRQGRVGF